MKRSGFLKMILGGVIGASAVSHVDEKRFILTNRNRIYKLKYDM